MIGDDVLNITAGIAPAEATLGEHSVAIAEHPEADPDAAAWTLSKFPTEAGWNTEGGEPGYGLPKALAEEIARRYNAGERQT